MPTVSTSTRNEPRATSTGTASTVSVRLSTHKTRMIWRRPSRRWNVNSTRPTTRRSSKSRTSVTPRSGTRSATAPFLTCCPAARPARKRPFTSAHTQDKPRLELTEKIEANFYSQDLTPAAPQPRQNEKPMATKISGKEILEAIRLMDADERRELTRALFA